MKHVSGTKKLTLHKETLRRFTRELTEQQLAKVLGGDAADGGPMQIPRTTVEQYSYWDCLPDSYWICPNY